MEKRNMKNNNYVTYTKNIIENTKAIVHSEHSKHLIITNVCSPMNKIVSGFSKELYNEYPTLIKEIEVAYNPKNICSYRTVYQHPKTRAQIIVANMYCLSNKQKHRFLNYAQLVFCMYDIKKKIITLKEEFPDFKTEIHGPKFGSAFLGGNWNFISELIKDMWSDQSVFIYEPLPNRTVSKTK